MIVEVKICYAALPVGHGIKFHSNLWRYWIELHNQHYLPTVAIDRGNSIKRWHFE